MTKADLLKSLRGYGDDIQVVIEVEDDIYVEIVSVGRLQTRLWTREPVTAIVLRISDPIEEGE